MLICQPVTLRGTIWNQIVYVLMGWSEFVEFNILNSGRRKPPRVIAGAFGNFCM